MEQVVCKYLKYLKIPVSKRYCEKLIASHPDYPSLLSIAETLERLGIQYKVVKISKKELSQVPFPYLLKPDEKDGELIFIKSWRGLTKATQINTGDLSPVILLVESTNVIADKENQKKHNEEAFLNINMIILISSIVGLLLFYAIHSFVSWIQIYLLLTAVAGTITAYLLIAKDLGIVYNSVEDFCTGGKRTNCDAVLNSDAARLFGPITFSDIAISYFLFQLVAIGFFLPQLDGTSSFLWSLSVLSILTIPVIIYSLYYQTFKIHSWCRLCLLIDIILILQLTIFGFMYAETMIEMSMASLLPFVLVILLFGAIGSGVFILKQTKKRDNESYQSETAANRVKYSPEVFMHLLTSEKSVDVTPFDQEIIIGNPDAAISVFMVISLNCDPCKEGFKKAVELIAESSNQMCMSLRIKHSGRNNGDIAISTYLLDYWQQQIYGKPNASVRTEKLILDWYGSMDIKTLKQKYPMEGNRYNESIKQLEAQHAAWLHWADITKTPVFFVNGHQLPEQYHIDDLKGMIVALADCFTNGNYIKQKRDNVNEFV